MSFKRSIWLAASLAGAALAVTLGALAQDRPPTTETAKTDDAQASIALSEDEVAAARFVEACTAGDWAKADQAYRDLVARWPAYSKQTALGNKHAEALFKLGKKREAAAALEEVLALDEDDVLALHLLAVIELEETDPQLKEKRRESAKERLLHAARNGFFVLREISSAKGKEFDELRNDPAFIMACMKASREFDVSADLVADASRKPVRNPFDIPKEGWPREASEKAKRAVVPAATPRRPENPEELFKVLLTAGNECLRAMYKANREEKFEESYAQFEKLTGIAAEMKKVEIEEFVRTADALLTRGRALREIAVKLERIKKLDIQVTGIVVDPRPTGRNRGVIVFDDPERRGRVYEAGDEIRDREDRRVRGLKVVEITEGLVRFRYDELDFSRPLKQPSKG